MADFDPGKPVLAHPESLELTACRQALRQANEQLLLQAEEIKKLRALAVAMGTDMARL